MSKWTQEQRETACDQFGGLGFIPTMSEMSLRNLEATIDLACQRNELLEALKAAEEFVDRHSEEWYATGQELLAKIRAAISKAEGK